MEKGSTQIVNRQYKQLESLLSELGGFAKTMIFIGYIITYPIQQLMFNVSIIKKLFNFVNINKEHNKNKKRKTRIQKLQPQQQQQQSFYSSSSSEQQEQSPQHDITQNKQENKKNQEDQKCQSMKKTTVIETKPSTKVQIEENNQNKGKDEINENKNNTQPSIKRKTQKKFSTLSIIDTKFRGLYDALYKLASQTQRNRNNIDLATPSNKGSMKDLNENEQFKIKRKSKGIFYFNCTDYFLYYIFPCNKKKKTLNYTQKKVEKYLDTVQLIQKLQEIDKLKYLLLDKHQIKLFEYLPKYPIYINDEGEALPKNSQQYMQDSVIKKSIIDFYPDDQKTLFMKAVDAYEAFQIVKQKAHQNNIDRQLIKYLDIKSIEQKFKEKQFDFRKFRQRQSKLATINQIQLQDLISKRNVSQTHQINKKESENAYSNLNEGDRQQIPFFNNHQQLVLNCSNNYSSPFKSRFKINLYNDLAQSINQQSYSQNQNIELKTTKRLNSL